MLTGSMAMNFYAVPRMTRDIDIIAEIQAGHAERLLTAFKEDFYIEREDILEAARDRGSFNIIHNSTLVKVDFLVRRQGEYRELEFQRRKEQDLGGFRAWMASPEDLILSKLVWAESGSEMQMRDVRNLLAAVGELDHAYLDKWAENLGVSELLGKARG